MKTSHRVSHLYVIQELEVAGPAGSLAHGLGQLQGASSALRPVVAWHGVRRAALFSQLAHQVDLGLGVRPAGTPHS